VNGDALQAIEPAAGAAVTAPATPSPATPTDATAAILHTADATPAATTDVVAARPTAEAAAPGATAGPAPAAPQLPMAVLFAAEETLIDDHATEKLRALARANRDVPQLLVVGNGPRPGLAMERARQVAALLVDAGIPAERLILEMGGESDVVVVYEPDGVAG
jgi:outer membrane protein OmpA-like peptidoglycan-associated protein